MSDVGFHIFGYLFKFLKRISKKKFLLASMKSLIYRENPSSNPLQEACSGFRSAACDSKSCSESRPCMNTREIHPVRMKESRNRNRNLMRLTEQSLELVSVFKEASRNFTFIFRLG